jgi:hypothetical protein
VRKIDAVCCGVSLNKNSRTKSFAAACMRKRQLPTRFAYLTGEKRDISAKTRDAPQQFPMTCVFFVIERVGSDAARSGFIYSLRTADIFLL